MIAMKRSKFTEQQIVFALKQAETGIPVAEVCRKIGKAAGDVFQLETKVLRSWNSRTEKAAAARRREQPAQASGRRSNARQADASGHSEKKVLRAGQRRELIKKLIDDYRVSVRRASGFACPHARFIISIRKVRAMTALFGSELERSLRRVCAMASPAFTFCCGAKAGRIITNAHGASI